MIKNEQ